MEATQQIVTKETMLAFFEQTCGVLNSDAYVMDYNRLYEIYKEAQNTGVLVCELVV